MSLLDHLLCWLNRPRLVGRDLGDEWADGHPRLAHVCAHCGKDCRP